MIISLKNNMNIHYLDIGRNYKKKLCKKGEINLIIFKKKLKEHLESNL